MSRFILAVFLLAGPFLPLKAEVSPPVRPIPAIDHVVIVSIDGLRPDCLLLADTPTLHSLIHRGSYSFWAKTTAMSITLPSHVSMMTGVKPARHGITWNRELPFRQPVYPNFPTVLELATRAGYRTAMVAGKAKFATLNKPGTISHVFIPEDTCSDETVGDEAVKTIETERPALLFIHFPNVDSVGHAQGWGSHAQLEQISRTDRQLERVLLALDRSGLRQSTFVLVTADHGGAGLTHGEEDDRSRHIPWIAVGPGVRKDFDLTLRAERQVRTEDTFATACYLLGLPLAGNLDGKPVYEAFQNVKP